jgi:hypothetical protein
VLTEAELDGIQISDEPEELRFDGDPMQFRFGVEPQRIDIAFTYESAAVAVSNIQPLLPHQLEAVYGCFLREPKLRFLLADDPGAGKTNHGRLAHEGAGSPPGRRPAASGDSGQPAHNG